jgi:ABC-type nitrate/sulfonate/bicarbonate transport system permease component
MASLQLYNTELLPPPSKSFAAVYKLWQDGTLTSDFGASMGRYIPGFFIGSLAGIIVGVVTGMFRSASYAVNPPFHYLRSIPPVALIPFMLVVFGIGNIGKISLVAWACMFPVWLSTQAGMKQVPKEYLQAAKTFGVDGIRRVLHVWLPCSLPHIVSGLRIAVSTGLFALAAAEMFAASSGIGFRIVYSYQLFQTDAMVGMILFLGFIAFVADALLLGLRALVARWESA